MITKDSIEKIIRAKIESDEKLGEQSGGSGHMGYVSYELNDFTSIEIEKNKIEVRYHYTIFVETEFTYYPDNPPYENHHEALIIVNNEGNIIEERVIPYERDDSIEEYTNADWENAKGEVFKVVEEFLAEIEGHYGENRAPIKYPPELYKLISDDFYGLDYCCMIETDLGDEVEEKIYFKSGNPFELKELVKRELEKRYLSRE